MDFKRKIYQKLLDWKKKWNGKTAILLEGARRIGKSTVVENFAKNEYKSYILVDFLYDSKKITSLFENAGEYGLDILFNKLEKAKNKKLYERQSVIIFDEVQKCPKARQLIKYLVADGRYDYIETGSLISIKQNVEGINIPSEEIKVKMYPMDFEEFLWALNKNEILKTIKQCYLDKKPLTDKQHQEAMYWFRQYMVLGGMPQSVLYFIETNYKYELSDNIKLEILDLYRDDIQKNKYAYKHKVAALFDNVAGSLSKHDKRVVLSSIQANAKMRSFHDSILWLEDAMMVNLCFENEDPNVGLKINIDEGSFKTYLCDTGLLFTQAISSNLANKENLYKQILGDQLHINEGMFFENIVAQSLVANNHKLFYYKEYNKRTRHYDCEVDFIIVLPDTNKNYKIFPVEVKSCKIYQTKSLLRFIQKYHKRIGGSIVIHTKNLLIKDNITFLPVYMTFCLKE